MSSKKIEFPDKVRGLNFFDVDENLHNFLRRTNPDLLKDEGKLLSQIGSFAGDRLDRQAEASDQSFPPELRDVPDDKTAPTGRRNEIRLNAEYEECQQELYRMGTLSKCFDPKDKANHVLPLVTQYLTSQSDISTGCPYAMTHPVAYILDRFAPDPLRKKYLSEVLRTDGKTAVCGTWATERHSGSDVGGSITEAKPVKKGKGTHSLHGHNWFTSAFGFKKFLAIKTARPQGAAKGSKGLGLYLVPSHIDSEWCVSNAFDIDHLKRKMGTKGLPTVEVTLNGTTAYEIAPEGQGLKMMMTALGCSRAHNAMAAAGVMHRAYLESLSWTANRETFGAPLITRPMIQKRITDIAATWMAGSALAFEAADSFDKATKDPAEAVWMRMTVAIAKYKTAEQAVWCAQKALEITGGNGYTEDYPTARLMRDAMVLTVWEGPEQIQALELMRMLFGKDGGAQIFLERMTETAKGLPVEMKPEAENIKGFVADLKTSFERVQKDPSLVEEVADDFLNTMSNVLAYSLLAKEAAWELQHDQNQKKLMVTRHYHTMVFSPAKAAPAFKKTDLQNHFNMLVEGKIRAQKNSHSLRP